MYVIVVPMDLSLKSDYITFLMLLSLAFLPIINIYSNITGTLLGSSSDCKWRINSGVDPREWFQTSEC